MGQRLSEAAVRGVSNPFSLSDEQKSLLTEGDIEGLLEFHFGTFGTAVMVESDEDDEDEDDDDEDDSDDDDSDDEDEDDDEDDEDDDEGEDDKSKSKRRKSKEDPKDVRIRELSGEARKYRLKNRDHRNRIAELEAQVAQLTKGKSKAKKDDDEDVDDSEVERRLEAERKAHRQETDNLRIHNAFLADKTFRWQNPGAALKLLDLSDVEVDEGDVVGLEDAIKDLAENHPYLLAETEEQKRKRKEEERRRRQGRTGQRTGAKRTKATEERLRQKYGIRR